MTPLTWGSVLGLPPGTLLSATDMKPVTKTQLAFYSAAAATADPVHYDVVHARQAGADDVIVNGSLRVAWLAQAVQELLEPPGFLSQFQCRHRALMLVGDAPRIEVHVQETSEPDGHTRLCSLSASTSVGERLVDTATCVVTLVRPLAANGSTSVAEGAAGC